MRYLKGSSTYGLLYGNTKGDTNEVVVFVDSDFVGDLDRRKSNSGYVFMLNICMISWKIIISSVVALSLTKAKFIVTP